MANLPPRPESPPRIREDRHYSVDDRERRPAQPMASRFRGDRYPDERVYVPRPKPDTYIAPGFEPRREMEGRRAEYDDRDRDRHRSFDRDRDKRNWGHERDGRRWEPGPDRDRRPYERDRGSNRPLSPQRRPVSRRFSRSPPRRRPYSPAPYRSRPRSRSRSLQPRRFRSGNYSRASPHSRSCSPRRQRSSHHRSRSRSQVHPETEAHNFRIKSRAASPVAIKVEARDPLLNVEVPMAEDRKQSRLHVAEIDVKALYPPPDTLTLNQPISRSPKPSLSQVDIKPEIRMASPVLQTLETIPTEDRGIIETIESASHLKTSPQSSMPIQAQPSPSSPRFPRNMPESTARVLPTGPQRNWPSRSPPRGPRSHPRQPMPPNSAPSYGSIPRGPRRGFPPTGPSSSFSSPASRHNPESKKNAKTLDPDLDIYRAQANRSHLAFDYLQRAKSLRRALHELDLATIDLRAAEIRRHIADVQLEKAKNGALGIDADALSTVVA